MTESTAVADDGLEPFVRTEGDGDNVVIIPVAVWLEREFDPILRSGRKLVFYDPQGSGRSAAGPPGRLTFENEVSTGSSNTACGWAIPRPPRTSKAIRGSTSRSGRRPSNAGNRRCSAISRSSDWRPLMKSVDAPALVVHGELDGPSVCREEWVTAFPHGRLLRLPGTGHWPFVERRQEFFAALTQFLDDELGA